VLLYDISNRDTFNHCKYWLENIRNYADENVIVALVPNKKDIMSVNKSKRQVPEELAQRFAQENNLLYIGEASALANSNIKETMEALVEQIYLVQTDLVKKGKKKEAHLTLSQEELMLNNHRCCY